MIEKLVTYMFASEDSYNDARDRIFRQMHNDYDFPKVEFTGRYMGEYRVCIWSRCSDAVKAAGILKECGERVVYPWEAV